MYKEFSIFLLLLSFILIPTDAFAWNDSDDNKTIQEPKKDQLSSEIISYDFVIYYIIQDNLYFNEDEFVDTHLLYEPQKWIDK